MKSLFIIIRFLIIAIFSLCSNSLFSANDFEVGGAIIDCPPAYYGNCGESSDPDYTGWPIVEGNPIAPDFSCYHASFTDIPHSSCGNSDVFTRKWTITNTCSEPVTICNQEISLTDDQAPELQCPDDYETPCDETDPDQTPHPQVFDACGSDYDLSLSGPPIIPSCTPTDTYLRIWTVTDDCDNTSSCAFNITLRCRPTQQASQIVFYNVTSNSMRLQWFNGDGNRRLVAMNSSNNFVPPVDGFDPDQIDQSWNDMGPQWVFNGDNDEVTVTDLLPNTTYWFRVYEGQECNGDIQYFLPPATGNPKSQVTTGSSSNCEPSSVIPNPILSPLPCTAVPGLYQSKLPCELYFDPPLVTLNPCDLQKCSEVTWRRDGQLVFPSSALSIHTNPCEILPHAGECFTDYKSETWAFRQRGKITGCKKDKNSPCMPCSTLTCGGACGNGVSHSKDGCGTRDDRRAWDINYMGGGSEFDVDVFAVDEGVIDDIIISDKGNSMRIRHPKNGDPLWYSWYIYMTPLNSPIIAEGMPVSKNQVIGNMSVPAGVPSHLHFGVYYKEGDKYISVDRTIESNIKPNNNSFPFQSSIINTQLIGSIISAGKVYYKSNGVWSLLGLTDENGILNKKRIPGIANNDSIRVLASGYKSIAFAYDSFQHKNMGYKIPLFKNTNDQQIRNLKFSATNDSLYYHNSNLQLRISGENYTEFDIIQYNNYDEGFEYIPVSLGHLKSDSIVNITLPEYGENIIGVRYYGMDTVEIFRKFYNISSSDPTFSVNLQCDSSILNSNLYINGQWFKNVTKTYDTIRLIEGINSLRFCKFGYQDSLFSIGRDTSLLVNLKALADSFYYPSDSLIIDFENTNGLAYYRNISVFDSTRSAIIAVKQYKDDFASLSLSPVSRKIEFTKIELNSPVIIRVLALLNQPYYFHKDSIYLLKISDQSLFQKILIDTSFNQVDYEPKYQRITYNGLSFDSGISKTEAIVLVTKRAPGRIPFDSISIYSLDTISVPLAAHFIDPDSIKNDMTFQLPDSIPPGISLSIQNGALQIISNTCESSHINFNIFATHDGLIAANEISIRIISPGTPEIEIIGETTFCQGDSVILTSSEGFEYLWSNGETSQSISVTETGDYSVIVTDENGCTSGSVPLSIQVNPSPSSEISLSNDLLLCEGDSLVLTADQATSYSWSNGDTTQAIIVYEEGVYSLTLTDTNGCEGISEAIVVKVEDLPIVDIGPDTIKTDVPIVLDAGNPGSTYKWNTEETSQTIGADSSGWYSVIVTDSAGCKSSDSIYIELITGTITLDESKEIRIYPNPNNGSFTLSGDVSGSASLSLNVFDPLGQLIFSAREESVSGKFTKAINLEKTVAGFYTVVVGLGSKSYSGKVIVNKD